MSSINFTPDVRGKQINPAWEKCDQYLETKFLKGSDEALNAALASHAKFGLPEISVSPLQGQFLSLLALNKPRILEIGTLGGYSTIWFCKAAEKCGGRVTSLEVEEKHAKVARANLKHAGYEAISEILLGDAVQTLKDLVKQGKKYDFFFIDADKEGYPVYLDLVVQLAESGSVIVADNVVREGKIADPNSKDSRVRGVQQFFDKVSANERLVGSTIQTVNAKGLDGFSYIVVL